MADATARRHYTGEMKPKSVKQKAREGSIAHHEHVGAKSETGEATVTRVDVDSGHGGAKLIGGGVSVTAVGKMTKQQRVKYHSIETKP